MAGTKRKTMKIKESNREAGLSDYPSFLEALKTKVHAAQVRASLSVNQELLLLYYEIGLELDIRCQKEEWGTSIVDRLQRFNCSISRSGRVFSTKYETYAGFLLRLST